MASSTLPSSNSHWLAKRLRVYYGWLIVPVSIVGSFATSPGQTYMVSVFNPSFRDALHLSLSQLTGAYMLGTILASLPQPYIGYWSDRVGIRRMLILVVVLFSLACVFIAQANSLFMLTLSFFFLRMLGQGALELLSTNMLPMWFGERLGRVSGFKNVIVSLLIGSVPIGVLAVIKVVGWRGTYMLAGAAVLGVLLPLALFIYVGRPEDIGEAVERGYTPAVSLNAERRPSPPQKDFTLKQAMVFRSYWILVLSWIAWAAIATAITFNLLPIFSELGLSEEAAVAMFSLLMITSAIFQILGGVLADRIAPKWLVFGALGLYSMAVGALILLPPDAAVVCYTLALGIGQGLFGGLSNTVWVRYFGRTHLGKIRGSVWTAGVAGSSVGPFLMGLAYDRFGDFRFSLIVVAGVLAVLAVTGLWATPPEQKNPIPATA
ncbi:MAG: MFS transporter [Anaerolineales bacterium]|nr:MAG: MFS transporter [Anaerolineales bacterium]